MDLARSLEAGQLPYATRWGLGPRSAFDDPIRDTVETVGLRANGEEVQVPRESP
jgi:hypothetical protein